jgi:undecaprenyl-phosphate galactose phosphotransferase
VFYKASAIGMHGKEFKMFKFRSMRAAASTEIHQEKVIKMILENEATTKLKNDPRITTIGKVLRKLSLDEFPQLINVIRGEMSLVGPRPNLPYEYQHMADWQKKRFSVIPGMTGLWQIKGRDEVLFNDQIVLDLYYIEHRSVKLDFEILLNTIPVVIFGKGGG